jgi:hypothetical protein
VVEKAELGKAYWDLNALSQIKSSKEAVVEFEAYLLNTFLKEALKPMKGGLFGGSFQASLYRELFCMSVSKELSQNDPLNLNLLFEKALRAYGSLGEK